MNTFPSLNTLANGANSFYEEAHEETAIPWLPDDYDDNEADYDANESDATISSGDNLLLPVLESHYVKATPNLLPNGWIPPKSPVARPLGKAKRRWTKEEDALLLEFIEHNKVEIDSPQDIQLEYWAYAADYVDAGWTGKRCRDRYINHLRPGIKKGDWSPDEIKLIREMYNSMGSKWSTMARVLKYRSENDIKNKWYAMVRKEERDALKQAKKEQRENAKHARKQQAKSASANQDTVIGV